MEIDFSKKKYIFDDNEKKLGMPAEASFSDSEKILTIVDLLFPGVLEREYALQQAELDKGRPIKYVTEETVSYEHILLTGIECQIKQKVYGVHYIPR